MEINKFLKCFDLWLVDNPNSLAKLVLISDVQFNGQITENTFEQNCEWRNNQGLPIAKPANINYANIASYEQSAELVPTYSN